MRLIDLIWAAIHCYPCDMQIEIHTANGDRYRPTQCGQFTKTHMIGGAEEKVFVFKVQRIGKDLIEQ